MQRPRPLPDWQRSSFSDLLLERREMKSRKDICKDEGVAPNKPKTPVSNFRIPPDLKAKAMQKAAEEGKTLTDVIVDYLKRYTRGM